MNKIRLVLHITLMSSFTFIISASDFVYLFSHGIYNDASLAYYYENVHTSNELISTPKGLQLTYKSGMQHVWDIQDAQDATLWVIKQPLYTFNYPDAQNGFDRTQTSLGQDNEIRILANAYEKIKENKVILMGMSRGATAILTFLGTRNPESVCAAIIESPFDSVLSMLDTHCGAFWLGFVPTILYTTPNLFFGKFDRFGICPIKVISKINTTIPILIIASCKDTYVPVANSAAIYNKFYECGFTHVYFLLLDEGQHGYLLEDENEHIYLNTVHAFYKKYNLPYHAACAQQGQELLAQCQPTPEILNNAIKNKKSFIRF